MHIERWGAPGKLDTASKGTFCKVPKGDQVEVYMQMSSNEEKPEWILLGIFKKEDMLTNINYLNHRNPNGK